MAYTTIDDSSAHFHTQLYAGDGNDDRSITNDANAGDFKPDWLWLKNRSSTNGHALVDTTRGATKVIRSQAANAEETESNAIQAFETDGFQIGTSGLVNTNGNNYVAWQWKANGGTTSSNSDGDITSTVQANTTAGFSIVTFTGNATAGQTVGHGLGVKPEVIFAKNRSNGNNWNVYVEAADNTGDYTLTLNGTGARNNDFNMWNDTAPTTSVITLGNRNETNGSSHNMVFYCFNSVKGYSKFDSYTGNGNADGRFVYTGFKPAFIIIRPNATFNWLTLDNKRDPINPLDTYLYPNLSNAEASDASYNIDFLANGFKFRGTQVNANQNGTTYYYFAWAEHPFVSSDGVPTTAR